jgi:hypothetical protein
MGFEIHFLAWFTMVQETGLLNLKKIAIDKKILLRKPKLI